MSELDCQQIIRNLDKRNQVLKLSSKNAIKKSWSNRRDSMRNKLLQIMNVGSGQTRSEQLRLLDSEKTKIVDHIICIETNIGLI